MPIHPDILKEMTPNDFDGDLKLIADACGTDVAIALWEKLPGIKLYIALKACPTFIDKYIETHGHLSARDLAILLGVGESTVRDKRRKYISGQNQESIKFD